MAKVTISTAAVLAAVVFLAANCGGSGTESGNGPSSAVNSASGIPASSAAKLHRYVQEDAAKHGRGLGCAWLTAKFPEATTGQPFELLGLGTPDFGTWGSGTVGLLDSAQFATWYASGAPASPEVRRSEGDGWVCYRIE
jgi:hypothetical protein